MAKSELFERMMESRFVEFMDALEKMIQGLGVGANENQRKALATSLTERLQPIFENLAPNDRPEWLVALLSNARNFRDDTSSVNGSRLLKAIVAHHHKIKRISLTDTNQYEFDKAYERIRDAANVPELFDKLISEISAILATGLIESVAAQQALESILAALKSNKQSSWWATLSTLKYVRWGWRFAVATMKDIPVLKNAVAATEQTMAETEVAEQKVREQLEIEAFKAIINIGPQLQRLADKIPDAPRLEGPQTTVEAIEGDFEVKRLSES
jgi:hypothetical protein